MTFNGYGNGYGVGGDGYGSDGDHYGDGIGGGYAPVYIPRPDGGGYGVGGGDGTVLTTTDGDGWVIHILTTAAVTTPGGL
jgi:hypothetical protein